jgi:hypothetical protein
MSLWRSPKPVIAQIHGWCVGGASDMALCADVVIAAEDAEIGTPYSRVWGCYLTGMWIYRLGLTRAKLHALTGEPLSGRQAADLGLINLAYPAERLEDEVRAFAKRLAEIPLSQLHAMKLVVNQAYENMGLASTQLLGPILDGSCVTPQGVPSRQQDARRRRGCEAHAPFAYGGHRRRESREERSNDLRWILLLVLLGASTGSTSATIFTAASRGGDDRAGPLCRPEGVSAA